MKHNKILIVDDEPIARDNLNHILTKEGYITLAAENGQRALDILRQEEVDLVITDLRMKGLDGMAVLAGTKKLWPATEVVVITGYASVDTAVEAMRQGAYHYIAKPFQIDELRLIVAKALEKTILRQEVHSLRQKVYERAGSSRIIGQSPKMQTLRETINQVAQLDCNVLIQGETGTGKELVAKTIHELSPRADKRFMAFNCGAFTEDLITSELSVTNEGRSPGRTRSKKGSWSGRRAALFSLTR
jgi:DNA-binding NtrC family response regulator